VTAAIDPFGAASPEVLRLARLNSYFETGLRSPLNTAILAGVDLGDSGFEKLDEIPFDFERRRTSIAVRSLANRAIGAMLIMKGAPESVLQVCVHCRTPNGPVALESELKLAAKRQADRLSEDGFRVLAVASREIAPGTSRSRDAETDMTLEGFLSFLDPPVKDARDIVAALRHDGVDIRILTGDNELVAKRICELTGIDGSRPVLGEEIERLSDPALEHLAENTRLFARVSPHQKVRIMAALRRRGHVVGFMGDGINDAPSLYAADVGISVASAVDVARDAAEIILTEPGLKILHSGIIEGRRAFGNVTKYLLMGTSSNFGNMFSMAAASLMLPFLPMLPAQILLNNFLYDLAQITIPLDHVDREFLRAPHRWDMGLIRDFMIVIGPVSSIFDFLTFYVLLHFLHASQPLFHTGWFVESLATQTLVLFVIRTARKPWSSTPSRALALTTVAIALAAVVIPWMPFAANIGFTPLPASYFAFLAGVMLAYLALVEFVKQRLFARRAARR
jgi:Mg2+-importing ATPase